VRTRLIDVAEINPILADITVPSEFSRITKEVSATMKAEQLKWLILAYFPAVLRVVGEDRKEFKVWVLLAYFARVLVLPGR